MCVCVFTIIYINVQPSLVGKCTNVDMIHYLLYNVVTYLEIREKSGGGGVDEEIEEIHEKLLVSMVRGKWNCFANVLKKG